MTQAGTTTPINISLVTDKPGMPPQRECRESGKLVLRDVVQDGQVVKSPVDIDVLPYEFIASSFSLSVCSN